MVKLLRNAEAFTRRPSLVQLADTSYSVFNACSCCAGKATGFEPIPASAETRRAIDEDMLIPVADHQFRRLIALSAVALF